MTKLCSGLEKISGKKEKYLLELSSLSEETLAIIVDLAKRPGAEKKLKEKQNFLKMFI